MLYHMDRWIRNKRCYFRIIVSNWIQHLFSSNNRSNYRSHCKLPSVQVLGFKKLEKQINLITLRFVSKIPNTPQIKQPPLPLKNAFC